MENESAKTLEVTEPIESAEEVTSTQEQENEVVTEENGENVEFTDSEESAKTESTPTQEDNSKVEESKPEKKVQTPEENSRYARERRKKEEMDNKVQEAYRKGRLEAYKGKINPYTNSEIKDETDIKVYENMYALDKAGKDPISDYANYIADKEREAEKERLEKEKIQENARKDIEDFSAKYPNIDIQELLDDESFTDYMEGKNKSLVEVYESFNKLKNQFRTSAIDVAKQTIANANASPGSLGSGSEMTISYDNMSSEEFNKIVQGVIDGDIK